jgi:hypothetical protein
VGRAFDVLELFNWQHLSGWSVLYLVGLIRCIVASNLRVVCGLNFRSPFVVQVFSPEGTVVCVADLFGRTRHSKLRLLKIPVLSLGFKVENSMSL